jgi:hypothetical protein
MFKKLGVFALILGAAGASFVPATAFAQDGYGYYGGDRSYYGNDRDYDRHERREWREHERREWREHERQERRAAEWREHEWREHRRENRWYYRDGDRPSAYFYYGFGR